MSDIQTIDENMEQKTKAALKRYYAQFGTEKNITIHEAAALVGISSAFIDDYMARTKGIGMPEDREEAQTYLKFLDNYL